MNDHHALSAKTSKCGISLTSPCRKGKLPQHQKINQEDKKQHQNCWIIQHFTQPSQNITVIANVFSLRWIYLQGGGNTVFLTGRPTIHLNNHIILIVVIFITTSPTNAADQLPETIPNIANRVSRNASCFSTQILSKAKQNHKLTFCANTHVIRLAYWWRGSYSPPSLKHDWPRCLSFAGGAVEGCFIINSSRQPRLRWRWKINNLEAYISVAYIAHFKTWRRQNRTPAIKNRHAARCYFAVALCLATFLLVQTDPAPCEVRC